jgi:L-cysteine:1D-myo-inositol 2-amino-2-deoxy-alpha-D-glucopyranoside ligase
MRLYNSQSRSIDEFAATDGHVGIYVCGVTPYDTTHIGHAFTFLTFDILVRLLRYRGLEVTYVQNVTDIDDDILRKAKELGLRWDELGQRETQKFLNDMRNLNAVPFDHYTAATKHVPEMVEIVERLLEGGFAYEVGGNVYFEVRRDPEFGKLSRIPSEDMLAVANERGNKPDDPHKRHPLDFVLWQAAAPDEPTWDSPWGPGRPGWHIECTAMATKYLGRSIDIHGGGYDLIFPHHECEIAQSENATGVQPFARFWMHVAMVNYEGEKMSKSLGNLVLASDLLERYPSDAIRLYLFSHHYRMLWEFDDQEMDEWNHKASRLGNAARRISGRVEADIDTNTFRSTFLAALEHDLHTPAAIGTLMALADVIHAAPDDTDLTDALATLHDLGHILGLTFGTTYETA